MDVGIRELKAKLSDFVGRAAEGADVVITDRGRPVARLVPFHAESEVERGIDEGWIDAPRRHGLADVDRVGADASTLDVLAADRS